MRELLWLGSFADKEAEARLKATIGYKKPATTVSQRNILEGLEQVLGRSFHCLGAVAVHGFPRDRYLRVPEIRHEREDGRYLELIGYGNLMYLNKLTSAQKLKTAAKRWVKDHPCPEGLDIFIYEARSACLKTARWIKAHVPDTKIHLIVPDLPQYMDLHMSALKKLLKQWDWQSIQKSMAHVDDFILYAQPMAKAMGIEDRPCLRMEGSIDLTEDKGADLSAEGPDCVIMYSGSINGRFGIMKLLEAMDLVQDEAQLWITGMGPDEEAVRQAAENRKNVHYYGFLPSREDVIRLQSQATAMVNMRNPEEPASAYCFPSKLFEYMLSGKPVLSCALAGIPEEYYDKLILMDSIQPKDIARAIHYIATLTPQQRQALGEKGRTFVLTQKNNVAQARRIVAFALGKEE